MDSARECPLRTAAVFWHPAVVMDARNSLYLPKTDISRQCPVTKGFHCLTGKELQKGLAQLGRPLFVIS